jgi:protein subunit release factor B
LGIKEKRQEKGEEEECMQRNIHIGNKWWKIMTIYSKEMKTTRTGVEDTITEKCMLMGRDFKRNKKRMDEREMEEDGKNRKGKELLFYV